MIQGYRTVNAVFIGAGLSGLWVIVKLLDGGASAGF